MSRQSVAVLVAHPDDETLWAGGTLLMERTWTPFVVSACRGSDTDRSPKFFKALEHLHAQGQMADLDDGPEQRPLLDRVVEQALLEALPSRSYQRILTHSPLGEYTRHRRHEEVARAVLRLWESQRLLAPELWLFAYEDGNCAYLPRAISGADISIDLPDAVWQQKLQLVTGCYGFAPDSWEARVTPQREAFHRVTSRLEAVAWLNRMPSA